MTDTTITRRQKIKNQFKTHSRKLAWTTAGVATLGCAFLAGKNQGINVELHLISRDDEGEFQKRNVKDL